MSPERSAAPEGTAPGAVAPGATPKMVTLDNVNCAQLVLRYLAMEGVTKIFGVPGAAIMQLLDELRLESDTFQYVVCRHETGAAYIADGYARVSGGLGVLAVTSGPGATNALTGTLNAHSSGTPLLTISGEVKEQFFGMGYLQEGIDAALDVDAVYRAAIGYSVVIDNWQNFCTLFEQALRDALSVPRRASHVSIPMDVAAVPIPSIAVPTSSTCYRTSPRGADAASAETALDLLLAAQRPLIMVGNGCRPFLSGGGLAALQGFVERFSIPVITTPEAKGLFPETHPMSLRNYGIARCMWPLLYINPPAPGTRYDALLVLGSSLGELAVSPATLPTEVFNYELEPAGSFVQVDLDASAIGRNFPIDLGVVADIGATVTQLATSGATRPVPPSAATRAALVAQIKQTPPSQDPPQPTPDSPVHPIVLVRAMNAALQPGSHIFVDAGNCVGWALSQLIVDPPSQLHAALSMGPMGFGVGAVVGAKMAAPGSTCVCIAGDGAFLMHGSEVSTAARYGVGAVWVVLNDNDLAMVSQGMNQFFSGFNWSDYYDLGQPDLVAFATALGAIAVRVTSATQLPAAFQTAFASTVAQPQVLVVDIDPTAVPPYYVPSQGPPVPPGTTS